MRNLSNTVLVIVIGLFGLLFVGAQGIVTRNAMKAHYEPARVEFVTATGEAVPISTKVIEKFPRLTYALVPGGVQSLEQLDARMKTDPVLSNYLGTCYSGGQFFELPSDQMLYVTFRRFDEIHYAKHPKLVKRGTLMISRCGKILIAACGNVVMTAPPEFTQNVDESLLDQPDSLPPPIDLRAPEVAVVPPIREADVPIAAVEVPSKRKNALPLLGFIPFAAGIWFAHHSDRDKPPVPTAVCNPNERGGCDEF